MIKKQKHAIISGTTVAAFAEQEQAHKAMDQLVKDGCPLTSVAVVGTDPKTLDHPTGRITFGRVVAAGAAQGIWLGLIVALIFWALSGRQVTATSLAAIIIGLIGGILFALLTYLARPNKDIGIAIHSHVVASKYEVIVTENAAHARELLKDAPGNTLTATAKITPRIDNPSNRPPRYGVRMDPAQLERVGALKDAQQTEPQNSQQQTQEDASNEAPQNAGQTQTEPPTDEQTANEGAAGFETRREPSDTGARVRWAQLSATAQPSDTNTDTQPDSVQDANQQQNVSQSSTKERIERDLTAAHFAYEDEARQASEDKQHPEDSQTLKPDNGEQNPYRRYPSRRSRHHGDQTN